jgi:hypothetical protein
MLAVRREADIRDQLHTIEIFGCYAFGLAGWHQELLV